MMWRCNDTWMTHKCLLAAPLTGSTRLLGVMVSATIISLSSCTRYGAKYRLLSIGYQLVHTSGAAMYLGKCLCRCRGDRQSGLAPGRLEEDIRSWTHRRSSATDYRWKGKIPFILLRNKRSRFVWEFINGLMKILYKQVNNGDKPTYTNLRIGGLLLSLFAHTRVVHAERKFQLESRLTPCKPPLCPV